MYISQQPSVRLEDGDVLYIKEGRAHSIYMEDCVPVAFFSHQFTFINKETQVETQSFTPTTDVTYSIGATAIDGEIHSGRFGTRIAMVHLEPGTSAGSWHP